MKRYSLALFAVLALGLIGLSPSKSHAAATCQVVTIGSYPDGYNYYCGTLLNDETIVPVALHNLGADAKTKLAAAKNLFFVFHDIPAYTGYCGPSSVPFLPCANPAPPSNDNGFTYTVGGIQYSVILEGTTVNGIFVNFQMANTAGHEAGHQLDFIYASLVKAGSTRASQTGGIFCNQSYRQGLAVVDCPFPTSSAVRPFRCLFWIDRHNWDIHLQ